MEVTSLSGHESHREKFRFRACFQIKFFPHHRQGFGIVSSFFFRREPATESPTKRRRSSFMAMEDLHRRRIDEREILGLIQEKNRNVSPNVVNKKRDKVLKKEGEKQGKRR